MPDCLLDTKAVKKAVDEVAAKPDGDPRSVATNFDSLAEREFAMAWAEYTLALRAKGVVDGVTGVQVLKVRA